MIDMQQDNHPDNYPDNVLGHQRKLSREEIERVMQRWAEVHKKAIGMDKLEWASWYLPPAQQVKGFIDDDGEFVAGGEIAVDADAERKAEAEAKTRAIIGSHGDADRLGWIGWSDGTTCWLGAYSSEWQDQIERDAEDVLFPFGARFQSKPIPEIESDEPPKPKAGDRFVLSYDGHVDAILVAQEDGTLLDPDCPSIRHSVDSFNVHLIMEWCESRLKVIDEERAWCMAVLAGDK